MRKRLRIDDAILDACYVATAHGDWETLIRLVMARTGAHSGGYRGRYLIKGRTDAALAFGHLSESALRAYTEYYWATNPGMIRARDGSLHSPFRFRPPGVNTPHLTPELLRTEFYNDWCVPAGFIDTIDVKLDGYGLGSDPVIAFNCDRPFHASADRFFEELGLHVGRAIAVARERHRDITEGAHRSLERDSCAAFDLDPQGRVIRENPLATTLRARDKQWPLVNGMGRVRFPSARAQEQLEAALRPGAPADQPALFLRWFPTGPLGARTIAMVVPLDVPWFDPARRRLLVRELGVPRTDADSWAAIWSLTRAEVEVAKQLVAGHSPDEIADGLKRKRETVRFHLKSLYAKTGARGQADLVRVLLSVPKIG